MSDKKQTSVEWLAEQLRPAVALQGKIIDEYLVQAKLLHEEEIKNAYKAGVTEGEDRADMIHWLEECIVKSPDQYYEENHISKIK